MPLNIIFSKLFAVWEVEILGSWQLLITLVNEFPVLKVGFI
jgi:hypothetical protein